MSQIELDTWAFVRLMVALEDQKQETGLIRLWANEWQEVDEQLAHLSQNDFEAYSEMMMATQISLDLAPEHEVEFRKTIHGLVADMRGKRKQSKDADFKKDLDFEIRGLSELL